MKTIGIVGGIAPPSTIEYYRSIVQIHRDRAGRPPRILINSLDGDEVISYLRAGRRADLVATLAGAVAQLAAAGAELALLASISVHIVFDEVRAASALPLIDIVEATADAVVDFDRIGLFATRFTVEGGVFDSALASRGVGLVTPSPDEQETIDRIYFGELVEGSFLTTSRDELLAIGARLRAEDGVDAILLGGTELPVLLPAAAYEGLPYLDSARLHAGAAVAAMLG